MSTFLLSFRQDSAKNEPLHLGVSGYFTHIEVTMVTPEAIKQWIEQGLPGAEATVSGDGHHFEAVILYDGFKNKSKLAQHRMVYDALGDKMKTLIHALSIKTYSNLG